MGSFDKICRTVSERAKPARALQANVLIVSASVIGTFTFISCRRTIMPQFDRTLSQTF